MSSFAIVAVTLALALAMVALVALERIPLKASLGSMLVSPNMDKTEIAAEEFLALIRH